jgi:transcriptional regulator with XRE-family HTH domain
MRRRELGVSQEKLAESIGLTFQQVQKYERAANRVSASKLWEVARALRTSVTYFYEGLGETLGGDGCGEADDTVQAFLRTPEGMEMALLFPQIRHGRVRRRLLELVRAMAEDEAGRSAVD